LPTVRIPTLAHVRGDLDSDRESVDDDISNSNVVCRCDSSRRLLTRRRSDESEALERDAPDHPPAFRSATLERQHFDSVCRRCSADDRMIRAFAMDRDAGAKSKWPLKANVSLP
jgi:hypothetical protein